MHATTVIFDIGNVLIRWQPEAYFDTVTTVSRRKQMFAAVDLHAMNERVDAGAPFRQTVYDTAAAHPEFDGLIRRWHDNWLDIASPVITETLQIAQTLRARGAAIAILSNIGQETFDLAAARNPFLATFDALFLSGPMAVTKPNSDIYQQVEDTLNRSPETLFFTDDRVENIYAADRRGWQTHLFQSPQGLAQALVAHGLLTLAEASL
jgi:2-haloacid dehalogenase